MKSKKMVLFTGSLALILVLLVLSIGGCAASTPTTQAPAPATTAAPAPATSAPPAPATSKPPAPATTTQAPPTTQVSTKVIELNYADWTPAAAGLSKLTQKWADNVFKDTGGRVKITCYPGESLVKGSEQFRAIQTGIVDIGPYVIGTASEDYSRFTLGWMNRMPFMWPGVMTAQALFPTLWAKHPEFGREYPGLHVFTNAFRIMPPNHLHTSTKAVRLPEDLRGMKITARTEMTELLTAVGAAPMSLGPGDWATSLEKGLVQGQIIQFMSAKVFGILPFVKYHTVYGNDGINTSGFYIYMANKAKWDSIPADLQKIITDDLVAIQTEIFAVDDADDKAGVEEAKKLNHTFINLTQEEIQIWKEKTASSYEKWFKDCEAKGIYARPIYEDAQAMIKEYQKK
jgi:TRAP-type transport system periplasmic protein